MVFKTEKRFMQFAIAAWLAFVTIDIAIVCGGIYVVYHFVCKFW